MKKADAGIHEQRYQRTRWPKVYLIAAWGNTGNTLGIMADDAPPFLSCQSCPKNKGGRTIQDKTDERRRGNIEHRILNKE